MDITRLNDRISQYLAKDGGLQPVKMVSAHPLSDAEKSMVTKTFPALAGKTVDYTVDPSVIAGLVLSVGSLTLDMSVRAKLKDFYRNLYENI